MFKEIADIATFAVTLIAAGALLLNWRAIRMTANAFQANAKATDTASYTKLADRIDDAYDGFRLVRTRTRCGSACRDQQAPGKSCHWIEYSPSMPHPAAEKLLEHRKHQGDVTRQWVRKGMALAGLGHTILVFVFRMFETSEIPSP